MKNRKISILAFGVLLISLLCSCNQIPQSFAQELTQNTWGSELENGTKVNLSFSDDNKAQLDILGDCDNTCTISGVCTVSEKAFVISDLSMAKNICIDYKLFGDKVELTYLGETISLDKIISNKDDSIDEKTKETKDNSETNSDSGS